MEFKVGDRVRIKKEFRDKVDREDRGAVVGFGVDISEIAVEFDSPLIGRHSCSGLAKKQHGWYVYSSQLELEHKGVDEKISTIIGDVYGI